MKQALLDNSKIVNILESLAKGAWNMSESNFIYAW